MISIASMKFQKYAPGIFLFASSGGGEGYGFDLQLERKPIVQVPFIGMDRQHALFFADDMEDFFVRLAD